METAPELLDFLDMELLAMAAKSDTSAGDTGHSPCIVR
jgi:hypothetical protein